MKLKPLLLLVACVAAANVGTAATRDEQTKACKHDAIKFCAIHIPNKEKIEACMKHALRQAVAEMPGDVRPA